MRSTLSVVLTETKTGCVHTIVASSVGSPRPTRLPTSTLLSLTRPSMGETTSQ